MATVALAAIGGALSCRQIVGITDNPPEDLVTSICGLPYGTNVCASCVNTSCCAESTACATDQACAAYQGCLGKCNGKPSCRSQCTIDNPVETSMAMSSMSACLASNCESACGLTCGSIADLVSPPDASASCESCLQAHACDQARACASSAACDARVRCWLACATPECRDTCAGGPLAEQIVGAGSFLGVGSLLSSADPVNGVCATQCERGSSWWCVDHVSWPFPTGSMATIYFGVADFSTNMPVSGVTVSVCDPKDYGCKASYTQETTNDAGIVSLEFANVLNLGTSGLNGYLQLESPDIRTTLWYWGFPLAGDAPGLFTGTFVSTPAEFQENNAIANVTPDPSRGTVAAIAFDCVGYLAPGVQVTLTGADALTQAFDTTGKAATATDQSGTLFFTNVPAGEVVLTAIPPAIGRPSSTVSATVRAGTTTTVFAWPSPSP